MVGLGKAHRLFLSLLFGSKTMVVTFISAESVFLDLHSGQPARFCGAQHEQSSDRYAEYLDFVADCKRSISEIEQRIRAPQLEAAQELAKTLLEHQQSKVSAQNVHLLQSYDRLTDIAIQRADWPAVPVASSSACNSLPLIHECIDFLSKALEFCKQSVAILVKLRAVVHVPWTDGLQLYRLGKIQSYLQMNMQARDSLAQACDLLTTTHGSAHAVVQDAKALLQQTLLELHSTIKT
eukprot:m.394774 g.394774  ORF g.394774 m.394774 type:complete len:237 (+) comp56380_c0_seq18:1699-2409(+)